MIKFLLIIISICSCISSADAATYTTSNNLFENSYSNNLIDMANSQINNFSSKSYVIFQTNNYDYYLVASDKKDVSINGNSLAFTNSDIVRVIRSNSGSSYYNYVYSSFNESSTIVNLNNIVISNLDTSYSVSSSRFYDYYFRSYLIKLCIFILAIVFAIFLTKGRSYL